MAKIFLGQMKTRICSALIASKILKSLARYALDHQSKSTLNDEADEFEMCAIECVRCAYFYDAEQTCEVILRRVGVYENVTCRQMAIAADCKKFLYEDACDALLTYIWYDKLDPLGERYRLIINMLTMGISQIVFSIYDKRSNQIKITEQESKTNTRTSPKRPFTTAHVHEQANYVWAYDRCAFIRDYYARPALFPPFTFLITIVQLCRWYWLMIPANFHVDNAWSEFERYSTNDYIRQLLAAQTDATTNIVTTDLTSESLTTDADEPKRFKLDINQWKDDFTRAQIDTSGRLSSMESTIAKLERQIEQMYQYFERASIPLDSVK
ncbi:unnamed protein product [Rotaria sp. Silwood2]|nr:unnamed protein product [Rotaria sp. Silwood2]